MLQAKWNDGQITVTVAKGYPCIVTIALIKAKGEKPEYHQRLIKGGIASYNIASDKPDEARLSVIKALRQGEHDSPPAGYPEDRSEYADPDHYMFPLNTKKRVRSAIGYFSAHDWDAAEHKKRGAKRILRAAKKFDIEVSKDSDVYRAAHS
ncbi:MAG: hypothetical protein PHZ23_14725 [Acidiphilium sp.]|nr:hypothetical protein [Acidiphilium sp.]